MNELQAISDLLGQWQKFTVAETAAIESAQWPALRELQESKAGLQKSITAALGRLGREGRDPITGRSDHPFRAEVNRLISLEAQNSQLLSARLDAAKKEKKSRTNALRNLGKVRRSYGKTSDAGWQSYS